MYTLDKPNGLDYDHKDIISTDGVEYEGQVLRVEKHRIYKKHEMYDTFVELAKHSNNLYNLGMYYTKEIYKICLKLRMGEELEDDKKELLNFMNSKIDECNASRYELHLNKVEKAKAQGKEYKKEYKPMKHYGEDNMYVNWMFLAWLLKRQEDFLFLTSRTAQRTLCKVGEVWKSYIQTSKSYNKNKELFTGKPRTPKYRAKGDVFLFELNNQQLKRDGNVIRFGSPLNGLELTTNLTGKIQACRFVVRCGYAEIGIVYSKPKIKDREDNGNYLSVDIGEENIAVLCNNVGVNPIAVNGKPLSHINNKYLKQMKYFRNKSNEMNGGVYTPRMHYIADKRDRRIKDYIHKASRVIINKALEWNCNTVIVGKIGNKRGDDGEVLIPYEKFLFQIKSKCEEVGLIYKEVDESFTSGTSFIDGEEPREYNQDKTRRVSRDTFVANDGSEINSDVNSAYQIMRKLYPNSLEGVECFHHPELIDI